MFDIKFPASKIVNYATTCAASIDPNKIPDMLKGYEDGYTEAINKAINEFEDAITQLGLDYHIPDEVMEKYCSKFKKVLEL